MGRYIAVDLGASNGRAILGTFDGRKIALKELNRFETHFTRIHDAYYWNVIGIYKNILDGLRTYAKSETEPLAGIGIDSWGCDYGLIDKQGKLVGNPRCYRDPRSKRGKTAFLAKYGERSAFDTTGITNMEFNTLFQLYDMVQSKDPQLEIAERLLTMPNLIGYMLGGEATNEYSHATTTQLMDAQTGTWSNRILDMVGIPESLLASIQMSGTEKGKLAGFLQQDTGLRDTVPIYNVGAHDTASAVASVPAVDDNYAFISSGTWSLMGIVTKQAYINDFVYEQQYSNEGTVDGGYRPLRNIMGLWILQSCKREWDREQVLSWGDIDKLVDQSPAFASFIDVNDDGFYAAEDMPRKIQEFCASTGQPVPQTKGEIARTVYESLAMSYKEAFGGFETLKNTRIDRLHIVGGGARNILLNQMTANAVGRQVVAGPFEATAIGNLMLQAKAAGEVKDWSQLRQVVCDSFDVDIYDPADMERWSEQYQRFLDIKEQWRKTCKG